MSITLDYQRVQVLATIKKAVLALLCLISMKSNKTKLNATWDRLRQWRADLFKAGLNEKSKSKVLTKYIRKAQYADDTAVFSETAVGLS